MEGEGQPSPVGFHTPVREVRVGLLIPTHALPILSYRIPDHLVEKVRPGAAVVAPLSGHSRFGIVVEVAEEDEHSREYLCDAADELSVPAGLAEACRRLSESFAVPLSSVLRAALPPGLNVGRYRIVDPAPGWPWEAGLVVGRTTLKKALGGEGLRAAEDQGNLQLTVSPPDQRRVEWARIRTGAVPDLGRAPRQRKVYETLIAYDGECETSRLLSETGASRGTLRELVNRGALLLEKRPEAPPILHAHGSHTAKGGGYARDAGRVADRGGSWFWRVPSRELSAAVAAFVEAVVEGGEQALVLAPEVETVEALIGYLAENLPAGYRVAPYHSGLDKKRGAVYEQARDGVVDVLVGTRTAALLPMKRLGAICVVDEPNNSHRAEPGYEGLPIHVREISLMRCEVEDCGVLFLSPFPTLRVSAPAQNTNELPARPISHWPAARIVDMRGTGANLSSSLVEVCRQSITQGKRISVMANRLGYATSLSCSRCGAVKSCPNCDLPLMLREDAAALTCGRCGYQMENYGSCDVCGPGRMRPSGFALDRLREEVSDFFDIPVGKLTAGSRENEDAQIVVATPRYVADGGWDLVAVPDADTLLLGSYTGATEQAFRLLYGAAEAAADLIVVQTRQPEHYALQAALRGDYPAFAKMELPRLRALGYPPYGHLTALTIEGKEETVRRAVESQIRPSLEPGVSMSDPAPYARPGERPAWRLLLRAPDREAVARAGTFAVRLAAKTHGANGLKARVVVDPEEV